MDGALHATAVRMKEEPAIAAAHHGESEPDDPAGLIAQFVRDPVALGDGFGVEQDGCNLRIGRALKPAIQRAQREDEPVASFGREHAEVRARRTPGQRAPQAERGGGTDVEELIERQEDGDRGADLIFAVKSQARSAQLDDLIFVFDSENGLEAARIEAKSRIGEAVRGLGQGHHARERLGRPVNSAVSRGI
jgi:hypothetical protein